MSDDDHLIMSRFENRIAKCKSPLDLDKLCRTYLEYRGKYNSKPTDPWLEAVLKTNANDRPNIFETPSETKKFSSTRSIDEYEYKNIDKTELINFQNNLKLQLAKDIVSVCVRDGFVKFGKEYNFDTMRHHFKAEMEVKKPKETR